MAAGPVETAVTTETITAAFGYPIMVEHADGRWSARAIRSRTRVAA